MNQIAFFLSLSKNIPMFKITLTASAILLLHSFRNCFLYFRLSDKSASGPCVFDGHIIQSQCRWLYAFHQFCSRGNTFNRSIQALMIFSSKWSIKITLIWRTLFLVQYWTVVDDISKIHTNHKKMATSHRHLASADTNIHRNRYLKIFDLCTRSWMTKETSLNQCFFGYKEMNKI